MPNLEREGGRLAAALFCRPLVVSAAGVGLNAVGLAVCNIDMTAVGLPSRLACGKVLVGIGDAGIVLFAKLIVRGVRVRIASQPEVLDERIPFFVIAQVFERLQLGIRDDPVNVLVDPLLIDAVQFALDFLLLLEPFFIRQRRFSGSGFSSVAGAFVTPSVAGDVALVCEYIWGTKGPATDRIATKTVETTGESRRMDFIDTGAPGNPFIVALPYSARKASATKPASGTDIIWLLTGTRMIQPICGTRFKPCHPTADGTSRTSGTYPSPDRSLPKPYRDCSQQSSIRASREMQ